ncbi:MAG: hypothetical protein H0X28_12190 [Solirubrobacterales bacterium]|nr:hypothetical protein [Solirubrobacterales bacterium]
MHAAISVVAFDTGGTPLTFVVFGAVIFSLIISLLMVLTRGTDNMYDHIGAGGFSREEDRPAGVLVAPPDAPGAQAEREEEVRQMLGARNARLVRRGEPPLDIEAELARLLAPPADSHEHDPGLVEEVRQLVLARNERRVRQGLEPQDVEAQVAATLAELDP